MAGLTPKNAALYTRFWASNFSKKRWFPGMKLYCLRWVFLLFWPATAAAQSADLYPLDLIRPGQGGYGKTVFEGSKVETFQVRILGVLENVGPKQNLILARLSGGPLEKTGIFAGMSGSPVYLEGKLAGAVAYAFPFAKEPIAGITPIQETVDIFKEKPSGIQPVRRSVSLRSLYRLDQHPLLGREPSQVRLAADRFLGSHSWGQLTSIATPLNISGFSRLSVQTFAPQLQSLGIVPVRGLVGAASDETSQAPLEPGSSISVQLLRGDLDLSAGGTVTHLSGNRFYAFGHPFLGIGYTDLPVNQASVLTIIPSLNNSAKISASTRFVGAIKQDRATGIMGLAGEQPRLIPVQMQLRTSRNETKRFRYEVVSDNFLTPFLITFLVHNNIVSSEKAVGELTLQVKCLISVKGQPDVLFENGVSDLASGPAFAAVAAASPVHFLLNSGFDELVMEKIELEVQAREQNRQATLDRVWQDKLEVRAGEEVGLTVFLRKPNGDSQVQKYPVRIPADITPGPLQILVGDGLSLLQDEEDSDMTEFIPKSLSQLIKAINNIKRNDRLYVRLYREQGGAVIAGEGLPGLPPSLLALYSAQKTSGETKRIRKVIYVEHELSPTDFVLKGQQVIRVNVKS